MNTPEIDLDPTIADAYFASVEERGGFDVVVDKVLKELAKDEEVGAKMDMTRPDRFEME